MEILILLLSIFICILFYFYIRLYTIYKDIIEENSNLIDQIIEQQEEIHFLNQHIKNQ